MSWWTKLFGSDAKEPKVRVRVCLECGQPLDKHSDWCAIFRTQQELDRKQARA